jgi:hypothetical protein
LLSGKIATNLQATQQTKATTATTLKVENVSTTNVTPTKPFATKPKEMMTPVPSETTISTEESTVAISDSTDGKTQIIKNKTPH